MARRRLAEAGAASIPDERILAIGDGILTDVKGALLEKLDVLFVTGGLAAAETNVDGEPQPERLDAFLGREGFDPNYTIGMLR